MEKGKGKTYLCCCFFSAVAGIMSLVQHPTHMLVIIMHTVYTNTAPDNIVSDENQYPKMEECYFVDQPIFRNNLDSKSPNKIGK